MSTGTDSFETAIPSPRCFPSVPVEIDYSWKFVVCDEGPGYYEVSILGVRDIDDSNLLPLLEVKAMEIIQERAEVHNGCRAEREAEDRDDARYHSDRDAACQKIIQDIHTEKIHD